MILRIFLFSTTLIEYKSNQIGRAKVKPVLRCDQSVLNVVRNEFGEKK